jgi:hypothetical protein
MEKLAKITPIQIAVAPKLSAYRGNSGAIIPTPSMEEKTEIARMGKTFFIITALRPILAKT